MEYFRQKYSIGSIYDYNQYTTWKVSGLEACKQFIDIIDESTEEGPFKISSKYFSYQKWKSCIDLLDEDADKTVEGATKLARLRSEINRDSRGKPVDYLVRIIELAEQRQEDDDLDPSERERGEIRGWKPTWN